MKFIEYRIKKKKKKKKKKINIMDHPSMYKNFYLYKWLIL